jgi:hypothetical protein
VFVEAWNCGLAKGTVRDPLCSGEILDGDVECVDVLLAGFTEPRRGVVQVAVQCGPRSGLLTVSWSSSRAR